MRSWYEGKRTLLTGASSGIGFELARQLASSGAFLLATGQRPEAELPDDWCGAPYLSADFCARDAVSNIQAWLAQQGWDGLDLLILNAGTGHYGPIDAESSETIATQATVNTIGPIALTSALSSQILAARGHVVFVGSIAHKGTAGFPVYASTKAALHAFVRALRSEWRGRAVVQILHPGPTRTSMHDRAGFDPGFVGRFFMPARDVAATMMRQIMTGRSPGKVGYMAVLRTVERQLMRGGR